MSEIVARDGARIRAPELLGDYESVGRWLPAGLIEPVR
jgi:hypothetical protein